MILCDQLTVNFGNITELSIIITIVGYVVVFIALAVMVLVIGRITLLRDFFIRIGQRKNKKNQVSQETKPAVSLTADANAAICTALYLFFSELHDEEKYVMTVKKVSKTYSPWSSKIYGIMNSVKR
jgi:Na+-transporting methylmalonyl-CoA/oxaloacetate decarboxylase gamma subunit